MRSRAKLLVVLTAVVVVAVVAGVVTAAGALWARGRPPVHQPIAFDHRLHVQEVGAECVDCHRWVLQGARATIPNIEVCGECHDEALTDSPEEQRLLDYLNRQERIPWLKVYWVPPHVYFSHRRHAAIAEIGCEVCHGSVAERDQPFSRPVVRLTMDRCMECHEERGASNDCLRCHR